MARCRQIQNQLSEPARLRRLSISFHRYTEHNAAAVSLSTVEYFRIGEAQTVVCDQGAHQCGKDCRHPVLVQHSAD